MLYDPKWEAQTQPVIFSLANLIAWLETMPAKETYCYLDSGECLLAQYFRASGKSASLGHTTVVFDGVMPVHQIPRSFQDVATGRPRTFGAALKRARAALCS